MTLNRRLRIGLTGGIGSGKSTVSALLAKVGAAVVDTDLIARQLSGRGGAAIPDIAAAFGAQLITADGALDRERMRALVFSDLTARRRLEGILHPLISADAERQASDTTAPATVFDVPLLVESRRWPALVDVVWVVDCEESIQRMRVMARSAWSQTTVERVISQQVTRPARRAHADAVIYNGDVNLLDLSRHVNALWSRCTRQPE